MTNIEKILGIVKLHLDLDKMPKPEDNIHTQHNADSLDAIEIVMALEEEFGIEISDTTIEESKSIQDMHDAIFKVK